MEKTVYGDLLFFVNFCMDFQCLFLAARLLRRSFHVWRSVLFSALGAFYACCALFLSFSGGVAFFLDLFVCFCMCLGAYFERGERLRTLFVAFGVYFGVSFAVGGAMSGMASLLSHVDLPLGEESEVSSVGFFLLATLGGVGTFLWGRFCEKRARGARAVLFLTWAGKELRVDGMVDTGNFLRDPVSGRSVVMIDRCAAKGWLPPALLAAVEEGSERLVALPSHLAARVRLVPAGTATGKGIVTALIPDGAHFEYRGERHAAEVLIAPIALHTSGGEYQALLPASLLEK